MAGVISALYESIALLSPRIEVKLRQFYWKNSLKLTRFNPNKVENSVLAKEENPEVDFDEIFNQLKEWGVKEGTLLIVHSSYDSLKCTGLSPLEIIGKLRKLIGTNGTLAMPVIRSYKEEPEPYVKMRKDYKPPKSIYNVRRTPVCTGLLPTLLMRTPGAEISLHPLNPICAVGPLAKEMMKRNISGENPSPHGRQSAWKFCLDHNAIIIGLGTDLRHHNTMGHVAEEAFDDWYWTDDEWYNLREFTIEKSKEENIEIAVRERKPLWGMLYQAEINRYHDFLKDGIIKSKMFGNILLEFEYSQSLISYLRKKNKNGYPYFK